MSIALIVACAPSATPEQTETPTATAQTSTAAPTAGSAPTPTPPSPRQIFDATTVAMEKAQSYHLVMDMKVKVQEGSMSMEIPVKLEGDFSQPDRMKAVISMTYLGFNIEMKMVQVGTRTWITDPSTNKWVMQEGDAEAAPADPQGIIGKDTDDLSNLTWVGIETVNGRATYRLRADTPIDEEAPDNKFTMDFWIDLETSRMVRASGSGVLPTDEESMFGGEGGTATMTLDMVLSDFDKPVTVEIPVEGTVAK